MDFNTLRYNLQQPYLQSNWQEWLQFIFGQQISIETQPEKIDIQKGNAISIERFASIALSDDKSIAVLDIKTTKDVQIARNRVALREIVFNLIDQDKYHGLIVFYHSEDSRQLDYRLSFISSQTSIDEDGNISTQSTNAKRYSFILGANESCNTAANRLLDLKNRVPKFKAFELQKGISLKDVTDTFSVEALNNEFFKKYKEIHYKRFWEYIANNETYANVLLNKDETDISKQQKPIRDFVKKMLGRIVFLHFLQKKGWMGVTIDNDKLISNNWAGGDKQYMLNLFEGFKNKENFYSSCLTILFYKTLNLKRKNEIAPPALTINHSSSTIKIPFLNGGLFDDDAPQTNNFNFPVEYFKDLFDFFSQYNFTIDENSPEEQEVGIDPEMLGHIFENLLEENKDKGAFYTPKEIVHYMCQESLIQYLRTHLPECTEDESQATKAIEIFIRKDNIGDRADKKNYIVANAKRIEAILDKVKICDPAIGSGAFPMGMLQEIFKAKTTLDLTLDKAQVKKEIIQNSIYGVDIEKGAVDIARLRFWLSLVVDEDVPQPLPNLDYKIMQGNSLLESFEEVDLSTLLKDDESNEPVLYAKNEQVKLFEDVKQTIMVFDKADKQDLQKLINLYFDFEESAKSKYKNKQEIKQAINAIIEGKLKAHFYLQKNKYEAEKAEAQKGIAANAIKPNDPKGIVDKKTKNLALIHKKLDDIDYKINHLTDILHKLNKWENEDKERPYFLWHTYFKDVFDKGGFDIVIGNPPYVRRTALLESFKNQLDGLFISAFKQYDLYVLFIEQGIKLLKKDGILSFINPNKFFVADYGLFLRKFIVEKHKIYKVVDLSSCNVFENALTYPIILFIENQQKQKEVKYYKLKKLEEFNRINDLLSDFNLNQNEGNDFEIIFEENNLNKIILNKINSSSCKISDFYNCFRGIPNSKISFEENNGFDSIKSVSVKKYFIESKREKINFISKEDEVRYVDTFSKEMIILPRTVLQLQATIKNKNEIALDRIYCLNKISNEVNNLFILPILNSKLINFWFEMKFSSTKVQGGYFDLRGSQIEKIPITKSIIDTGLETLANKILSLKSSNNSSIYFENKIDALVFHLYGLTEVEMNQVLDTFKDLDTKDRTQIINEYKNISNNKFRLEI